MKNPVSYVHWRNTAIWALLMVCGTCASPAGEGSASPKCTARMVKPDSFTGLLLYATVRIETLDGDNRDTGDGTGFFSIFPMERRAA